MRLTSPTTLAFALAMAVSGNTSHAQVAAERPEKAQVISINPLSLMFGGLSAEWESRVSPNASFGLGASLWAPEDYTYTGAEAKYRFYPEAHAPRGFSLGGSAGFTRVTSDLFGTSGSTSAFTAGIELDYQWLLGESRSFALALGLGAKRLFLLGDDIGASGAIPTLRVSIGYAY